MPSGFHARSSGLFRPASRHAIWVCVCVCVHTFLNMPSEVLHFVPPIKWNVILALLGWHGRSWTSKLQTGNFQPKEHKMMSNTSNTIQTRQHNEIQTRYKHQVTWGHRPPRTSTHTRGRFKRLLVDRSRFLAVASASALASTLSSAASVRTDRFGLPADHPPDHLTPVRPRDWKLASMKSASLRVLQIFRNPVGNNISTTLIWWAVILTDRLPNIAVVMWVTGSFRPEPRRLLASFRPMIAAARWMACFRFEPSTCHQCGRSMFPLYFKVNGSLCHPGGWVSYDHLPVVRLPQRMACSRAPADAIRLTYSIPIWLLFDTTLLTALKTYVELRWTDVQ